ncbi:hypothetical protein HYV85_02990 [Candidatus Woesearchaeota archaeon]|nr:hypothetical protein [Candidatus Woesearchaeota archaeon]
MLKQRRREEKPVWVSNREREQRDGRRQRATGQTARLEQRLKAAGAVPVTRTGYDSTSYDSAAETPALPGEAGGGAFGGGTSTVRQPWHFPRLPGWVYVAGLGVAALAVYVGVQLAAAQSETRPNTQARPTAVSTPYRQPTPVVSQYKKQALEQIAAIRQKEPGLAAMLAEKVNVMSEDGVNRLIGFKKLVPIQNVINDGNYSIDTLVGGADKTFIVAVSKDEYRRTAMLAVFKAAIPTIEQFLGVNYSRPLLMIDLDNTESGGGGERINIEAADWTLRNKTHEAGHDVWEVYPLDFGIHVSADSMSTPRWLQEGVAEFAGIYAAAEFYNKNPGMVVFWPASENGKVQATPATVSLEAMYQELSEGIKLRTSKGQPVADVTKGFVFLYEFRQLVGQDAFAEAMGHLYDVKVERGNTIRTKNLRGDDPLWTLTEKKIEDILAQKVPPDKLPKFRELYQSRVYGVQETKP